jgi:RES domain-containing protein
LISSWRITKKKHINTALSGEGARLYGGRWNTKGKSVIYTAESRALAVTEMLVHLDTAGPLSKYVVIRIEFDDTLVKEIDLISLPANWRAEPAPRRLQAIGDDWIETWASVVLRVPSAVIQGEFNYLLNPAHADFGKLKVSSPESFRFDKRLR